MRYVTLVLALAAGSAHAQVVRCTAPDGKVTYTQGACSSAARSAPVAPAPPPFDERPDHIRRAIASGHIVIGMTRAELDRSAGRAPDRSNRSVRRDAVDHQLVYDRGGSSRLYVYLTDGVITSFQSDDD